jgi:hypothetical protein
MALGKPQCDMNVVEFTFHPLLHICISHQQLRQRRVLALIGLLEGITPSQLKVCIAVLSNSSASEASLSLIVMSTTLQR